MEKPNFLQAFLIFLLVLTVGVGSGYLIQYYLAPTTQVSQLLTRVIILLVSAVGVGVVCRLAIPTKMMAIRVLYAMLGISLSILIFDRFFPGPFSLLNEAGIIHSWSVAEYTQAACLLVSTIFISAVGKKKSAPLKKTPQKATFSLTELGNNLTTSIKRSFNSLKQKLHPAKTKPVKKSSGTKKPAVKSTPVKKSSRKAKNATVKVKSKSKTITAKKKAAPSRSRRKANNVTLVGREEHRCPYCLELVKKNDPRGVVICPDCGTWHHKDCWNVTGSCQIAHKHEL